MQIQNNLKYKLLVIKKIVFAGSLPFITSRPPWILIFYTYFVAITSLIPNSAMTVKYKLYDFHLIFFNFLKYS